MWKEFFDLFEVPSLLEPHIPLIVTEDEAKLVVAMNKQSWSMSQLVEYLGFKGNTAPEMVKQYYRRGILNKVCMEDGEIGYAPATLYLRLGIFAQYENDAWNTIAGEKRAEIDRWYLNEYKNRIIANFEEQQNKEAVLPLNEAIEHLNKVQKPIYLLPCNCRLIAQNCSFPVNVCLQFSDGINSMIDRDWGEKISKHEAIAILTGAEKAGLMHTASSSEICNCDSCCCYPFRTALMIGSKGKWPKSNYIVQWDGNKCINCGICAKRCHFRAFTFDRSKQCVSFNENKCWGCGVCASACPRGAISLIQTNQKAGDR
ncbi:MAG: ATP-binding protein [Caulobacteraceae bacterium]